MPEILAKRYKSEGNGLKSQCWFFWGVRVPCSQSKWLSQSTSLKRSSEKFSGVMRFESATAGWEVRTLPLCYAAPLKIPVLIKDFITQNLHWRIFSCVIYVYKINSCLLYIRGSWTKNPRYREHIIGPPRHRARGIKLTRQAFKAAFGKKNCFSWNSLLSKKLTTLVETREKMKTGWSCSVRIFMSPESPSSLRRRIC